MYKGDVSGPTWGRKKYTGKRKIDFDRMRGIAIHHAVGRQPSNHDDCALVVAQIQEDHLAKGYRSIAYNAVICAHGYVFRGRWFGDETGANGVDDIVGRDDAPQGPNQQFFAVCFLGTNPKVTPTRAYALASVRRRLLERAPHAKRVVGHNQFRPTACPGEAMRQWVASGGPRLDPEAIEANIAKARERLDRALGR